MLINSVELRNIKSYATPGSKIVFRPGVNLIWGQNGSGKTTILEAIGYALFGALDYNIGQFVRAGTKDSEIVLTVEAKDERLYQVVRSLKGSGKLEIFDPATKRKITVKKKDSEDWLTDNLGIEYGGYGKRLFETSLGVAQGKMTGSFLENETARKAIFAPILRVDEYDIAWKKLTETGSELNSRLSAIREEVARLEGRLQELPIKEGEKVELARRISTDETELETQKKKQEEQANELKEFEAIKDRLEDAKRKIEATQHQLDLLSGELRNAKDAFLEADNASKILESTRDGYELYRQVIGVREELLGQQKIYQDEQRKLSEIEKILAQTNTAINTCLERLEAISNAEAKIDGLEPLVQRQIQLEAEISVLKSQIGDFQHAASQAIASQELLTQLEQELANTKLGLEQRVLLENELAITQATWNQSNDEENQLSAQIAKERQDLEALADQRTSATSDAKTYEMLSGNLQSEQDEIGSKKRQLEEIKQKVQKRKEVDDAIAALQKDIDEARTGLITAQADQKVFQEKTVELDTRLKLLMNTESAECPICKTPLDQHQQEQIEGEYSLEIKTYEENILNAQNLIGKWEQRKEKLTKKESRLRKQQSRLPTEQRLEELSVELSKHEEEQNELTNKIALLFDAMEHAALLENKYQSLLIRLKKMQKELEAKQMIEQELQEKIRRINQELYDLPQASQAADLEVRVKTTKSEFERWTKEAEALSSAEEKMTETHLILSELNDPRSQQHKQRGIAEQRLQVESDKNKYENTLATLKIEHSNQTKQLEKYTGLDNSIEIANAQIQQNKEAYQEYIANEKVALMRQERLNVLNVTKHQYKKQEKTCTDAESAYAQIEQQYDAECHTILERENRQVGEKIAALNAKLNEMWIQKERLDSELEQLYQLSEKLEETRVTKHRQEYLAEVFKFVRESIRMAGPKVVKQRVKAISYNADRVFQDIIGDPSLVLNWDESYAIKICHRQEERIFNQLSGGEQMAAAIAVRVAVMFHMSDLRILFLDEPTANMDDVRRENLANRITALEGLRQIFVITHDDAFRRDTHHVIQIHKENDTSLVSVR